MFAPEGAGRDVRTGRPFFVVPAVRNAREEPQESRRS